MSRLATLALFVREDVRDTRRERHLYMLVGIYVALALLVTYAEGRSSLVATGRPELVPLLFTIFAMLTPLLALGFFAAPLVERRSSGALKIVLGLPIDRGSVVVGTFIARSIVVCTAVFAALVAAAPLGLAVGLSVDPVRLVGVGLLLALLGVTFTALAVGISAIVRTSTRATIAAFGVFILFFFQLWAQLPRALLYVLNGLSWPATTPEWVAFVAALNPIAAFSTLVDGLYPALEGGMLVGPPAEQAFYQEPAFGLGVLLGWIVLGLGVGYWRFRTTDL